jgi:hypothetical protein
MVLGVTRYRHLALSAMPDPLSREASSQGSHPLRAVTKHRHRTTSVSSPTPNHVADADLVASPVGHRRIRHIPRARTLGIGIGIGRTAIGAIFFAAPVTALRIIGTDSATATRVTWLSRMTAARDGAIGLGTVRAVTSGRGAAGWLLAGAASDAVDAVALAGAVRDRRAGGLGAIGMVAAAVGTSALGVWAAAGSRRR